MHKQEKHIPKKTTKIKSLVMQYAEVLTLNKPKYIMMKTRQTLSSQNPDACKGTSTSEKEEVSSRCARDRKKPNIYWF